MASEYDVNGVKQVVEIVLGVAEMEFFFPIAAISAMLCIGSSKGVDNIPVFWLLLGIVGTASALSLQHSVPHQ